MQGERESSIRFFIQMIANTFLCKKAYEIISKMAIKSDRIEKKAIIVFIIFAIILFLLNQAAYIFFKNPNLYEIIGAPRRLTISEMKQWSAKRRIQLYQIKTEKPSISQSEFLEIVSVLTHPARRLSYDSFGQSETNYAWAFKFPGFILQTIIGSAVFFVMCTFMRVIGKKKSDLKQAFKLEIFAMILLFIWEVDLIVTTESRLDKNSPDWLDYIYFAFPIFQRRQMIKCIIIPCMNLVQIFIRFYTISISERKLLQFGNIEGLKQQTNPIYQAVSKINIDEHINDRINVTLQGLKKQYPIQVQTYRIQRQLIGRVLYVQGQQVLPRPQITRILKYFKLQ